MFVETPYTGKGKLVAFLPETFDNLLGWSNENQRTQKNPFSVGVNAYWVEHSKTKTVVAFGMVSISLDEINFPQGINTPSFTFGTFLEIAGELEEYITYESSEYTTHEFNGSSFTLSFPSKSNPVHTGLLLESSVYFNSTHKLGNSRAFYRDNSDIFPRFEEGYDPVVLATLLSNPSQVPANAVGWFTLKQARSK